MARWLLALAVTLAMLLAPAAHAASRLIPLGGETLQAGPVLTADGSVIWVASGSGGAHVMRAPADGAPQVIAPLPPSGAPADVEARMTYALAASDQVVAVRRFSETCRDPSDCKYNISETRVADVLEGVPGGPLTVLAGCGYAPGEPSCGSACPWDAIPSLPRVSGPYLAMSRDCTRDPIVRVLGVGRSALATIPTTDVSALTDQDLLASTTTSGAVTVTVTLYRWATGEVVSQATFVGRAIPSGVDVGPGSSLVYAAPGPDGDQHLWVVPAGGAPRDAGRVAHYATLMATVGDRVLIETPDEPRFLVRSLGDPATTPVPTAHARTALAFDGTGVAYGSRPCRADVIVVQPVGERPAPSLSTPCPAPRPTGPVRVGSGAHVALACPSDPLAGCSGTVRVILLGRRTGPGAAGRHALPPTDYTLAPGGHATVTLTITPPARAFLRRTHARRAIVSVSPAGEVPGHTVRAARPVVPER